VHTWLLDTKFLRYQSQAPNLKLPHRRGWLWAAGQGLQEASALSTGPCPSPLIQDLKSKSLWSGRPGLGARLLSTLTPVAPCPTSQRELAAGP
jgi:hypothetical protein